MTEGQRVFGEGTAVSSLSLSLPLLWQIIDLLTLARQSSVPMRDSLLSSCRSVSQLSTSAGSTSSIAYRCAQNKFLKFYYPPFRARGWHNTQLPRRGWVSKSKLQESFSEVIFPHYSLGQRTKRPSFPSAN